MIFSLLKKKLRLVDCLIFGVAMLLSTSVTYAQTLEKVELYNIFERSITNTKTYSNPFDYTVVSLNTQFTHRPTGRVINFFGFYDGNGSGGQTGSVWKIRFMPDQTGIWDYTWTWSDGTSGGSGSFEAQDTGVYPGPLKVASDNSWYFATARNQPFHFRGYDMHIMAPFAQNSNHSFLSNVSWVKTQITNHAVNQGYNFIMLDGLNMRFGTDPNNWTENW